jgi:hypothetical protein
MVSPSAVKASFEDAISAETSNIYPQANVNPITTKILQYSDAPNPESDAIN